MIDQSSQGKNFAEKNDFAERSKIFAGYRSENNFVGPSK